jgi:hypothetical protein
MRDATSAAKAPLQLFLDQDKPLAAVFITGRKGPIVLKNSA